MRIFLLLLLVSVLAYATLDQTYIQTVDSYGSSTIVKTMALSVFSNQLVPDALSRMDKVCRTGQPVHCVVDVGNKTVTIEESFTPGGYYTYTTDYGLLDITHTLVITRIPTDSFSNDLQALLNAANATTSQNGGGGGSQPIDLNDRTTNQQNAVILKELKTTLNYTVVMPLNIDQASAGNVTGKVSGSEATFDLVDVMAVSEPIVITTKEPNLGYLTAIVGVIVLVALAVTFFGSKAMNRKIKK